MTMELAAGVDLRAMVREVLREAIRVKVPLAAGAVGVETVRIQSDADLQAFIARLSAVGVPEALRTGALKFTLAGAACAAESPASKPAGMVLDGVISERKLHLMPAGATVVLAQGAVLTPLAKDLVRRLGLKLERKSR